MLEPHGHLHESVLCITAWTSPDYECSHSTAEEHKRSHYKKGTEREAQALLGFAVMTTTELISCKNLQRMFS